MSLVNSFKKFCFLSPWSLHQDPSSLHYQPCAITTHHESLRVPVYKWVLFSNRGPASPFVHPNSPQGTEGEELFLGPGANRNSSKQSNQVATNHCQKDGQYISMLMLRSAAAQKRTDRNRKCVWREEEPHSSLGQPALILRR